MCCSSYVPFSAVLSSDTNQIGHSARSQAVRALFLMLPLHLMLTQSDTLAVYSLYVYCFGSRLNNSMLTMSHMLLVHSLYVLCFNIPSPDTNRIGRFDCS